MTFEEIKSKVKEGKYFLWKANADSKHSGYIVRREVGKGFLKLNNKGSVILVLPERYTIDINEYSQVAE